MLPKTLYICLIYGFFKAESANILIFSVVPFYSHNLAFLNVWKELHNIGHSITFATPFPDDESLVNFTVIDTRTSTGIRETVYTSKMTSASRWFAMNYVYQCCTEAAQKTLLMPEIQDMIHNPDKYRFDAVISELWLPTLFLLSKIHNCPAISFATIDVHENLHWHVGHQMSHAVFPDMNSGLFVAGSFLERLTSFMFTSHELVKEYMIYAPMEQAVLDRVMGKRFGNIIQLKRNNDLILLNGSPMILRCKELVCGNKLLVSLPICGCESF